MAVCVHGVVVHDMLGGGDRCEICSPALTPRPVSCPVDSPERSPTAIGERLSLSRRDAGLTVGQAAAHIGVPRDVLVRAEIGEPADREVLIALARAYDVRLDWIEAGVLADLGKDTEAALAKYARRRPVEAEEMRFLLRRLV